MDSKPLRFNLQGGYHDLNSTSGSSCDWWSRRASNRRARSCSSSSISWSCARAPSSRARSVAKRAFLRAAFSLISWRCSTCQFDPIICTRKVTCSTCLLGCSICYRLLLFRLDPILLKLSFINLHLVSLSLPLEGGLQWSQQKC